MEHLLIRCIEVCEKCIDICQKVIDFCETQAGSECGKQIGLLTTHCAQCIEICQETITKTRRYLELNPDPEKEKHCDWVIKKARDCIESCKAVVSQCHTDQEQCIKHCFETIRSCSACAQACQQVLDIYQK